MHTNVKTKNGKELLLQALVDSEYTHTEIDKQLVKEEKIKTEPIDNHLKFLMQIEQEMKKSHNLCH